MKPLAAVAALALILGGLAGAAQAGSIDPNLQPILDQAGDQDVISVLVFMRDTVDVKTLNEQLTHSRVAFHARHETVVRSLQEMAAQTQQSVLGHVERLTSAGLAASYEPFWIDNSLRVEATRAAIKEIAARDDVGTVYYNPEIELIAPKITQHVPEPATKMLTPEVGLVAVRAPEVWALGFDGTGILIATLDTGVDGTHPALASRWRGLDSRYAGHPGWAWFDPVTNTTFPQAFGAHGTHTMGTVLGGAPGDQVGVAPGAQWIHAAVIDRVDIPTTVADAKLAFQWLLDPDGDPATSWDVPTSCSNSWGVTTGHGYPPCSTDFWSYIDNCEAAGIVVVFSAGNEGSSPETLRRPADRATTDLNSFAVGAIDANTAGWPIAGFSSRGPSHCTPDGSAAIKPEVVAPGVEVRSSVPGGGYESSGWDGTSMASPHVNGAIALIRQACPDLSVTEVKQLLIDTAQDLGTAGNDNDYGYGMIDIYDAVQIALSMCSGAPRARDSNLQTPVNTPLSVTLLATDYDGLPNPPGQLTYIVTSLPLAGNTVTDAGNGHVITAAELPYSLVNYGNQVLYTPATGYYGNDSFQFKANDGGVPPDGGDSNTATIALLVLYPPPVITTDALPQGLKDASYGPVQLQATPGQPPLTWSVLPADTYYETDLGTNHFALVGTAQGWHADDQSWSYTLPFTFHYFGADYSSVWVCSNGYLNFGSEAHDWGNSDQALIAANRIAVMFDDLLTNVSATDDIYIDASVAGQVTFRWQAVTITTHYAINCSITLFADGRIWLNYGSGNTGQTATIGISAGDGTRYLLSTYNNSANLTNANTHEFFAPLTLPTGVTISASGVLSGVPTDDGTFSPTFRVVDALNRTAFKQIPLVINLGPHPPVAQAQAVSTTVNTVLPVTLVALDDGLPNPPATVTYSIASLPSHGTLVDPGAGVINTVPHTLVGGGQVVNYRPGWWYIGTDTFTFTASDGGTPPEGGSSLPATVTVTIPSPPASLAYSFPLDTNPGWTTQGLWAWGHPIGGGSHKKDPANGHTGTNVYGYNLNGDYTNNMQQYNLTTTAINCTYVAGTQLKFWRWLGVEGTDHASVQVSNNGTDWTTLWSNPTTTISENAWTQMSFDISAVADGKATVYVRWTMGTTDAGVTYPGWNIDDIEFWGVVSTAPPACRGDCNCDGQVNFGDIDYFVTAIPDNEAAWRAYYAAGHGGQQPSCPFANCDITGDGHVNFADIDPFVALIPSACP